MVRQPALARGISLRPGAPLAARNLSWTRYLTEKSRFGGPALIKALTFAGNGDVLSLHNALIKSGGGTGPVKPRQPDEYGANACR